MNPSVVDQGRPRVVLTEELRTRLKRPLGRLLSGAVPEVYEEMAQLIAAKRPSRVVLVGDAVSRNAEAEGLRRDVMIIDNEEKRVRVKSFESPARRAFRVQNEPGTISLDAWAAVRGAIECGDAFVIVDGEEDMLTLAAIVEVPPGSFVIYGQPDRGVVLVEVDKQTRKRARAIIKSMKRMG